MKQFGRVVKWAAVAFCVAFIAIQLVPVSRTNPPVQGDFRGSTEVVSVLRRACYDCHSNRDRVAVVFARSAAVLGHCP